LGEWFLALFVAAVACAGNYLLGMRTGQVRWAVRGGFLALIGGLVAYSYLAVGLPGSSTLMQKTDGWGVLLITLLGALIGAASAWVWNEFRQPS
jgi:drug/metabolite transporter (DMT)-like permease